MAPLSTLGFGGNRLITVSRLIQGSPDRVGDSDVASKRWQRELVNSQSVKILHSIVDFVLHSPCE
ncbi:unnamed protein product [Clonostachys rosea f. rosea IK726]|uniref:Uncharacterized protein n=1 Tax=Clonostachys rosea f. rosea IK726 TaxID=1349383 RepID=A0ACA9TYY1_BIOOC|nr:unnamed protein product [Clonostachys rosea f. rosea IK726]